MSPFHNSKIIPGYQDHTIPEQGYGLGPHQDHTIPEQGYGLGPHQDHTIPEQGYGLGPHQIKFSSARIEQSVQKLLTSLYMHRHYWPFAICSYGVVEGCLRLSRLLIGIVKDHIGVSGVAQMRPAF